MPQARRDRLGGYLTCGSERIGNERPVDRAVVVRPAPARPRVRIDRASDGTGLALTVRR